MRKRKRRLTRLYTGVTGRHDSFDEILHASKMRITGVNLASEINVLAQGFHEFALADRRTRDFTFNGMRGALCEILAAFPVYRTYVARQGAGPEDIHFIDWAVAVAKRRSPAVDTSIFDFIRAILTGELDGHASVHRAGGAAPCRALPAGERPGHGEGARGYELLPLCPPARPQRGRQRPAPLRPLSPPRSIASTRSARNAGRTPC